MLKAVALYKAGETPQPRTAEDKAMLAKVVSARVNEDAWASEIRAFWKGGTRPGWSRSSSISRSRRGSRSRRTRTASCALLQSLGFAQGRQGRREGKKRRLYLRQRADAPAEDVEPIELCLAEENAVRALESAGWEVRILGDGRTQVTHPGEKHGAFPDPDVLSLVESV